MIVSLRDRIGFRRRAGRSLGLLLLAALSGCASAPERSEPPAPFRPGGIDATDLQFLERAQDVLPEGLNTLGMLSFTTWPVGAELLSEAGAFDQRVLNGVRRIVIGQTTDTRLAVLDTRRSRFLAAVALHRNGWRRNRGEWRSPEGTTRLLMERRGPWIVEQALRDRPAPAEPTSVEALMIGSSPIPVLEATEALLSSFPSSSPPAALLWTVPTAVPDLPERLLPRAVVAAAYPANGRQSPELRGRLGLVFADQQSARVALVSARLLLPTVIQRFGLSLESDFDILRQEQTVLVGGIAATADAVLDLVLTGGEW